MIKCRLLLFIFVLMFASNCMAQIGYQVSLLNNVTGEPRANECVNVVVRISDSDGGIICEQTKQETTNDFGVLSMTVGNSGTFGNVDWSKLPFFIEASVDGRLIGKSQILSVPIAEYAKQTGVLTKEILSSKTWIWENSRSSYGSIYKKWTFRFSEDGSFVDEFYTYDNHNGADTTIERGHIEIDGNLLFLYYEDGQYHNIGELDVRMLRYSVKRNDLVEPKSLTCFR